MSKVRIQVEVLSDGVSELMRSAGIVSSLDAAASRIARVAGDLYEAKPAEVHGDRAMALVVPTGREGALAEATEKRLSKAVTACKS